MEKRLRASVIKDCLCESALMPGSDTTGKRYQAIIEVLARIPKSDYKKFKSEMHTLQFFIPSSQQRGCVVPISHKELKKIIYLSPVLEKGSCDIIDGVIAHEIAHVTLDHKMNCKTEDYDYDRQEDEAFQRSCEWSFEKQARKHRALIRRLDTLAKKSQEKALNEIF